MQVDAMFRGEPAPWQYGSQFSGAHMFFGRQYFMASNDAQRCREELQSLPVEKQRLQAWLAGALACVSHTQGHVCSIPGRVPFELSIDDGMSFWLGLHKSALLDAQEEVQKELSMF